MKRFRATEELQCVITNQFNLEQGESPGSCLRNIDQTDQRYGRIVCLLSRCNLSAIRKKSPALSGELLDLESD
jgi:hypothetical protein